MGRKRCIAMIMSVAMMMLTLAGCVEGDGSTSSSVLSGLSGNTSSMTMIGISMSGTETDGDDGEVLFEALRNAGYSVELAYAEDSSETQASQLAAMVQDGASALIVDPVDAEEAADTLDSLDVADVVVLAYGEPIDGKNVDYYLGWNWQEIGRQQAQYIVDVLDLDEQEDAVTLEIVGTGDAGSALAMEGALAVLQSYIDEGTVTVLSGNVTAEDCAVEDMDSYMETLLTEYYEEQELNALLCFGEGQAVDAISGLMSHYLGSVFPVVAGTGYDEEIDSLLNQYMLSATVYAPDEDLTDKALSLVQAAVSGSQQDQEELLAAPVTLTLENLSDYLVDGEIVIPETDGNATDGNAEDDAA